MPRRGANRGGIRGEIVELAHRKRRRSTAELHEDTAYCTLINATVLRRASTDQ
jgi:hypothetical protein